ncbi:SET domain-containing protein [Meloidogyne graminicola]|uniref:SET domain-containing protein n=1 Tax=Meloidogyne graminicola TaxID=189291 RepID=A0A8S9ZLG4_9BILA|nr:SET domain-containing protein [Meloidogyne graminicola]
MVNRAESLAMSLEEYPRHQPYHSATSSSSNGGHGNWKEQIQCLIMNKLYLLLLKKKSFKFCIECYFMTMSAIFMFLNRFQLKNLNFVLRFSFDSSELLALFFALERIYFDYFCKQTSNDLNDETLYIVQWEMEIPNGLKNFLGSRRDLLMKIRRKTIYVFSYKLFVEILHRYSSQIFFNSSIYLLFNKNGKDKLKEISSQLPLECRERLLEQLSELAIFEGKFFNFLNDTPNEEITKNLTEMSEHSITFGKKFAAGQHIVNTRSLFTEKFAFFLFKILNKTSFKKKNSTEDEENTLRLKCVPLFDKKLNCYKVIAEHSIGAGQQLFFCYSAHSNDQL